MKIKFKHGLLLVEISLTFNDKGKVIKNMVLDTAAANTLIPYFKLPQFTPQTIAPTSPNQELLTMAHPNLSLIIASPFFISSNPLIREWWIFNLFFIGHILLSLILKT